jgi:hypothetical protein
MKNTIFTVGILIVSAIAGTQVASAQMRFTPIKLTQPLQQIPIVSTSSSIQANVSSVSSSVVSSQGGIKTVPTETVRVRPTPQLDMLGMCKSENAKLKKQVRDLTAQVTQLREIVASSGKVGGSSCVGEYSITRSTAGAVTNITHCADNGYACDGTTGKCFDSCNNSTWCAVGFSCYTTPRPGHCGKLGE